MEGYCVGALPTMERHRTSGESRETRRTLFAPCTAGLRTRRTYSNRLNAEHVQECLLGKYCFSSGQPTNTCSKTATIRPNMKSQINALIQNFLFLDGGGD